jgi:membrane-bound lytic murein transglycosylase D
MLRRHKRKAGIGGAVLAVTLLAVALLAGAPVFAGDVPAAQTAQSAAAAASPNPEPPAAPATALPNPELPAALPPEESARDEVPVSAPASAALRPPDAAPGEVAPDEPAQPEDAALQDELDDTIVEEEPAPAEPQAEAAAGPRIPKHGVPVPQGGELFPSSAVIERQKAFWIRAFTAMDSRQGFLHDGRGIEPIYETVQFEEEQKPRQQNTFVKHRIHELGVRLNALAERLEAAQPLDEELERLRALLPRDETPEQMRERAGRVRFQRGLSDRFRNGLVRSGAILAEVQRIMVEHGVPGDLAYLPHVESSFNNATLSRAGAAGIWQFTRGTGRIFLTVQGEVDERLDPVIAARAAAIFLKQNHERLGTWPLAITAYNHGPQSLERIVARTGTIDLGTLIETYNGPLFKFASKNFYSEFLAARQVATHFKDYFGDVDLARPQVYARVQLPFFLEFDQAARAAGVPKAELALLNPSLRPTVLSGTKYIPKGFRLRVPPQSGGQRFLAAVPDSARASEQRISSEVRVARGDTLFSIGRRNNIPWPAIAAANNLGPRSRLFVGQRLLLPRPGQPVPTLALAAAQVAPVAAPAAASPAASPAGGPSAAPSASMPVAFAPGSEGARTLSLAGGAPADALQAAAPRAMPALALEPSGEPSSPLVSAASLALHDVNLARQEGRVRSAYGETVGHYATWAQISAPEIRERNGMGTGGILHPGRQVVIPLHAVSPETFNGLRLAYHRAREQTFFSAYAVRDKFEVRLARGQSVWSVAQENNVPMWLLYRENPVLLERPVQAGMRVVVPRVEGAAANGR